MTDYMISKENITEKLPQEQYFIKIRKNGQFENIANFSDFEKLMLSREFEQVLNSFEINSKVVMKNLSNFECPVIERSFNFYRAGKDNHSYNLMKEYVKKGKLI